MRACLQVAFPVKTSHVEHSRFICLLSLFPSYFVQVCLQIASYGVLLAFTLDSELLKVTDYVSLNLLFPKHQLNAQ